MSSYSLPPPLPTYHVLLEGEGLGQALGNCKDDLLNVCMRHVGIKIGGGLALGPCIFLLTLSFPPPRLGLWGRLEGAGNYCEQSPDP